MLCVKRRGSQSGKHGRWPGQVVLQWPSAAAQDLWVSPFHGGTSSCVCCDGSVPPSLAYLWEEWEIKPLGLRLETGAGPTSWMQQFAYNSEEDIHTGKHQTVHSGFTIECVRRVGWTGSGGSPYVYQGNCPALDEFATRA